MSEPNNKCNWELFVSDEIVINILSYLETKDVLRYRCVSKGWRDLTLTPYFVDLHKKHWIGKMIVVDVPQRKRCHRNQFFFDEWWLTARKKPTLLKFYSHPQCSSDFSQDGLLVMSVLSGCRCSQEILIANPIFPEKVKIVVSSEWHSSFGKVYGIYFNPTLKEYCVLFDVHLRSSTIWQRIPITYKMLTLGPKPCLRDIRNPFKDRHPTSDLNNNRPVMVDGFLYWMINLEKGHPGYNFYVDIMEFDIRSNEFKVIKYPGEMKDYARFGIDLLNNDGFLSLVHLFPQRGVVDVNIWTLKDRASESWTCSHYYVDGKVYPGGRSWMRFETIAYKHGVLIIQCEQRLYVCNLELGTSKVLGSKTYNECSTFFSHDMCLSSLKNCKPVIRIGNKKNCRNCDSLEKKEASSANSSVNEHSDIVEEIAISILEEGSGSSTYVDGEMTFQA